MRLWRWLVSLLFPEPAPFTEQVREGLMEHYDLMLRVAGPDAVDPQVRNLVLMMKAERRK